MGLVWKAIEHISFLLESDEREAILGDLRERPVSTRDFWDICALVLHRQLTAWFSLRPWVLSAALFSPALIAAFATHPIASILYSGHFTSIDHTFGKYFIQPWEAVAGGLVCWAVGFTVGSLGGRRLATLLGLGCIMFGIVIHRAVVDIHGLMNVWGIDSLTPSWIVTCVMLLWATVPLIHGFTRALRHGRLSPGAAWMIAGAFVLCKAGQFHLTSQFHLNLPKSLLLFPINGWPVLYLLWVSRPSEHFFLSRSE